MVKTSLTPLTIIHNKTIYKQFIENLPHNSKLNQRAKDKRKEGILSEVLFWQQVHKNKFHHIDFDRQTIIGHYIVDFYVKSLGLVIEIDGSSHDNKQEYDQERQTFLEALGLKVFRCTDKDVETNIKTVLSNLEDFIIKAYSNANNIAIPAVGKSLTIGELNNTFAPIDILDYIYAILHSPIYREKYKEFLKIDFPRVPYPKDQETFWQLVALGKQIRQIHLLESDAVEDYITQYPEDGNNIVTKLHFLNFPPLEGCPQGGVGKVYINETQYFDNVSHIAWEFYIGGYQPAQKWLKDRKGRLLEFDDILHYQKIIVALTKTHELMQHINLINIE